MQYLDFMVKGSNCFFFLSSYLEGIHLLQVEMWVGKIGQEVITLQENDP